MKSMKIPTYPHRESNPRPSDSQRSASTNRTTECLCTNHTLLLTWKKEQTVLDLDRTISSYKLLNHFDSTMTLLEKTLLWNPLCVSYLHYHTLLKDFTAIFSSVFKSTGWGQVGDIAQYSKRVQLPPGISQPTPCLKEWYSAIIPPSFTTGRKLKVLSIISAHIISCEMFMKSKIRENYTLWK
jgi:hypothetical protein